MNNKPTTRERLHLARVKEHRCIVCGQAGPSDAHHIKQHNQYLCIPLCKDCHQGSHNGIHGRRAIWNVNRMDEMDALNEFLRSILG